MTEEEMIERTKADAVAKANQSRARVAAEARMAAAMVQRCEAAFPDESTLVHVYIECARIAADGAWEMSRALRALLFEITQNECDDKGADRWGIVSRFMDRLEDDTLVPWSAILPGPVAEKGEKP